MAPRAKPLTTTPLFVVSDLRKSLEFYEKLGFIEPSVWGHPPCFAIVNRSGFDLMLSVAETPDQIRPNGPNRIWDCYIRLADIGLEIEALRAAGVALDRGPTLTVYQMLEIEVVDPDGYRICFGQDAQGHGSSGDQ